ncbi:MAG: pyrroline-5-carboxylate reductase [Chitinophagaceae bacterium]
MMSKKIAILGGGNLGTAIADGLLKSNFVAARDLVITRRKVASLDSYTKLGVAVMQDNAEAVRNSNLVILAVKPFQVNEVLKEIADQLTTSHILVSVVTGFWISDIKEIIEYHIPIFRAMPNTAIAIQQSMTCISHTNANHSDIEYVYNMFDQLGKVVIIDEALMNASTVLGACGTAFAMRYIRANIQGGIEIGFDAKTASLIAAQTVKGAADLLLQKGSHPEQEIDKVTTPKGCTIAGLNEMEHQGFSSSLIKGISASYKKIATD